MTNDKILHKWINGTISPEELAEFRQRPEFPVLEKIYRNSENLGIPKADEDEMLKEVLSKGKIRQMNPKTPSKLGRFFLAVAAVFIALVIWNFFPTSSTINYTAGNIVTQKAELPDGSIFHLNSGSHLSFDEKDWKENRELTLKGEAFFEVTEGSKFTVKTENGNVQVLGTEFNVRSRKNGLEVKCQSGRVAVISATGQQLADLTKGMAVRIKGEEIEHSWELNQGEKADWSNGIFRFKKVALSVVLAELERQFDIQINADSVDDSEIITTNFNDKNLDLALTSALQPLGYKFEMEENGRLVKIYK